MSDYKRFVSYFYPYTPDKQTRSVGFAKIEIRDKKMKIEIQVKGISFQSDKVYPVYVILDTGELRCYDAGNLKVQKSSGFFKGILEEGSDGIKEFLFPNTVGIYVKDENNTIYSAYWGEKTFSAKWITEGDKRNEENKIEEIKEHNLSIEKSEKEKPEKEKSEKPDENVTEREESLEDETPETPKEDEDSNSDMETMQKKTADVNEQAQKKETENMKEQTEKSTEEPQKKPVKEKVIRKEELENVFLREQEFFENPQFYECEKIEPKDLKLLPTKEWILGKNSFLLHGYYNYRYLLYGKLKRGGFVYRFIGVPGVFHNQEKVMANLFGFSEFEPVKKEKIKTGKFGYWIRIIDKI